MASGNSWVSVHRLFEFDSTPSCSRAVQMS